MKVQKKVYLPPALARRAARQARREGISESAFAERAIRNLLKEWKRKP